MEALPIVPSKGMRSLAVAMQKWRLALTKQSEGFVHTFLLKSTVEHRCSHIRHEQAKELCLVLGRESETIKGRSCVSVSDVYTRSFPFIGGPCLGYLIIRLASGPRRRARGSTLASPMRSTEPVCPVVNLFTDGPFSFLVALNTRHSKS